MAKQPYITTKKDGSRIVKPDFSLKEKLGTTRIDKAISPEKVEKAETMVEQDKELYAEEALQSIQFIQDHMDHLREKLTSDVDIDTNSEDFRIMVDTVLNLKSQSAMYGYPLATAIAKSLFEYLQSSRWFRTRGLTLTQLHINALHRIYEEQLTGDGGETGQEIITELEKAIKL